MIHVFGFLVLDAGGSKPGSSESCAADSAYCRTAVVTASGARRSTAWKKRADALKRLAASRNAQVFTEASLSRSAGGELPALDGVTAVIIFGQTNHDRLQEVCKTLNDAGKLVMIAVDALKNLQSLLPALREVNEEGVQMISAGSVELVLTAPELMIYRFPKPDSTSTICVVVDIDARDPLILSMVRGHAPFQGCESLPGGFINVQLENLAECAARELMEECFFNNDAEGDEDRFTYRVLPSDLVLIDERSDPDRDERGHVVDHGYAWFVPESKKEAVMAAINAGDDALAGSTRFVRASQLLERKLAFDHARLVEATLERLRQIKGKPARKTRKTRKTR
ncbi:MAG: NUDIX hydrolase [Candidatus Melainabacteria bacterium]|nr:NUDIX hydrolase [Candidatus Melainabacteria bacterium]